jgi:hypothetical protein
MPKTFWIGPQRAAMIPPFMLPRKGPTTVGEGIALRLWETGTDARPAPGR